MRERPLRDEADGDGSLGDWVRGEEVDDGLPGVDPWGAVHDAPARDRVVCDGACIVELLSGEDEVVQVRQRCTLRVEPFFEGADGVRGAAPDRVPLPFLPAYSVIASASRRIHIDQARELRDVCLR